MACRTCNGGLISSSEPAVGNCTGWPQPRSFAERTCASSAAPMMDTVQAHTSCGSMLCSAGYTHVNVI